MPSVGIYRPPAARKLDQNVSNVNYRSPPTTTKANNWDTSIKKPADQQPMPNVQADTAACEKRGRQRRPDMAVYVPRGQRIAQEHQRKLEAMSICNEGVVLQLGSPPYQEIDGPENDKQQRLLEVISHDTEPVADIEISNSETDASTIFNSNVNLINPKDLKKELDEPPNVNVECGDKEVDSLNNSEISVQLIEYTSNESSVTNQSQFDEVIEKVPTAVALLDTKQIPATIDPEEPKKVENVDERPCVVPQDTKTPSIVSQPENFNPPSKKENKPENNTLNPEDLDWDTLYDDFGECLEPSLVGQLTRAVGQVAIETPKTSYDDYKPKNLQDEFPHVVELYDFPPEFKTPDLVMIFSDFKNAGYEIKWVDDTHALGVFSNANIVSQVLTMQHPLVKIRCLSEGSQQSKSKARRCADSLTPYMPRPDTCAALARRLVTGALGVKLPTQRAEREAERKLLREAREKKKLAAKQREEAWEGNFS